VAVAATIVVTLANISLTDVRASTAQERVASVKSSADATVAAFLATLRDNPERFTSKVDRSERARVCTAQSDQAVYEPGADWPASCGLTWSYTDPQESAEARIEITPPNPNSAAMIVNVFASSGETSVAKRVLLTRPGTSEWTVSAEADLDLAAVQDPAVQLNISGGSYYSGGNITLPDANAEFTNSVFAAEGQVSPQGVNDTNRYVEGGGLSGQAPLRRIAYSPLSTAGMLASVDSTQALACAGTAPGATTIDSVLYSNEVCLHAGSVLVNSAGVEVAVPEGVEMYMIRPTGNASNPTLDVFVSAKLPVVATSGNINAQALDSVAASTHPGALSYWTSLGNFPWPVSGIVASDADLQFGLCSSDFTQSGALTCAASVLPKPLTVIAGSADSPASLIIGSPVERLDSGSVTLAATKDVVLPTWAFTRADRNLNVDANLLATGAPGDTGAFGVVSGSPIHAFPPTVDAGAQNEAGELVITGSVAAASVDFASSNLFSSTVVLPDSPELRRVPATPYAPSYDRRWVLASSSAVPPAEVCASNCDAFLGGADGSGSGDTTPPPAPATLTAVASPSAVQLTWPQSAAGDVEVYVIQYRLAAAGASPKVKNVTVQASACASLCTKTINGLSNGTSYRFTVLARDTSKNSSPPSTAVTITPNGVPETPTGVAVVAEGPAGVRLTWSRMSGAATDGYRVYRDGEAVPVAVTTSETWSDTSLAEGVTHSYQVAAYNAAGESALSAVVTGVLIPGRPATLTAANAGAATGPPSVSLTWSRTGSVSPDSYLVYRSTTSTRPGSSLETLAGSVLSFSDTSPPLGRTVYYWVMARSAGADSTPVLAQVVVRPSQPTGVTATPVSGVSGQVQLGWDLPTSGETVTRWQVLVDGVLNTTVTNTGFSAGSPPTATLNLTVASHSVVVRATSDAAAPGTDFTDSAAVSVLPAPNTPVPTAVTSGLNVTASWSSVGTATSYQYEVTRSGAGVVSSGTQTGLSKAVSGSTTSVYYTARVRASNASGVWSPWSAQSANSAYTTPSAPTISMAASGNNYLVSWSAPAGSASYNLDDAVADIHGWQDWLNGATGNSSLAAYSLGYSISTSVQACNSNGCSAATGTSAALSYPRPNTGATMETGYHPSGGFAYPSFSGFNTYGQYNSVVWGHAGTVLNWGLGGPTGSNTDMFASSFSGFVSVSVYTCVSFQVNSDDGHFLLLNTPAFGGTWNGFGYLTLSRWTVGAGQSPTGCVWLAPGTEVGFVSTHFELDTWAYHELKWSGTGGWAPYSSRVILNSHLRP
jgi:hypothetical protein